MAMTVAFVWKQPDASPYYHVFPNEPIPGGSLMVSKVIPLKNNSVPHLLDQITSNVKSGENVMIVGHGNENGLGFYFGAEENNTFMDTDVLGVIQGEMDGLGGDEDDSARRLWLSVPEWRKLRAQIQKVQTLKLDRVDMRACRVGKNRYPLSALQIFFGCETACAPTQYDAFGGILFDLAKDGKAWAQWLKAHPVNVMTGSAGSDGCAVAADYSPFKPYGLADDLKAVPAWVKAHLPPGSYSKPPMPFHALTELTSSQVPIFAGDADFTKNLREELKGKGPSRTIDINKATIP